MNYHLEAGTSLPEQPPHRKIVTVVMEKDGQTCTLAGICERLHLRSCDVPSYLEKGDMFGLYVFEDDTVSTYEIPREDWILSKIINGEVMVYETATFLDCNGYLMCNCQQFRQGVVPDMIPVVEDVADFKWIGTECDVILRSMTNIEESYWKTRGINSIWIVGNISKSRNVSKPDSPPSSHGLTLSGVDLRNTTPSPTDNPNVIIRGVVTSVSRTHKNYERNLTYVWTPGCKPGLEMVLSREGIPVVIGDWIEFSISCLRRDAYFGPHSTERFYIKEPYWKIDHGYITRRVRNTVEIVLNGIQIPRNQKVGGTYFHHEFGGITDVNKLLVPGTTMDLLIVRRNPKEVLENTCWKIGGVQKSDIIKNPYASYSNLQAVNMSYDGDEFIVDFEERLYLTDTEVPAVVSIGTPDDGRLQNQCDVHKSRPADCDQWFESVIVISRSAASNSGIFEYVLWLSKSHKEATVSFDSSFEPGTCLECTFTESHENEGEPDQNKQILCLSVQKTVSNFFEHALHSNGRLQLRLNASDATLNTEPYYCARYNNKHLGDVIDPNGRVDNRTGSSDFVVMRLRDRYGEFRWCIVAVLAPIPKNTTIQLSKFRELFAVPEIRRTIMQSDPESYKLLAAYYDPGQ